MNLKTLQMVASGCGPGVKKLNPELGKDERFVGRRNYEIEVEPMGAVRMNRSDAWMKRPRVLRYRAYRDALRAAVKIHTSQAPDELHLIFWIQMPKSWTRKKCLEMAGKPHRQKPDRDNLDKAVCDALFPEDCSIWKGSQAKYWTSDPSSIRIEMVWL